MRLGRDKLMYFRDFEAVMQYIKYDCLCGIYYY